MNSKFKVEVKALINQIMGLALDINSNEDNLIEVHVNYSGHVNGISISIYENGFLNQNESSIYIEEMFYFDDYWIEITLSKLSIVLYSLEDIKETGALNIQHFTGKRVRRYSFTNGGC